MEWGGKGRGLGGSRAALSVDLCVTRGMSVRIFLREPSV